MTIMLFSFLRDMNQKLRDDKDAIEAAHEAVRVGEPTIDPPGSQYLLVDFFWVLTLVYK